MLNLEPNLANPDDFYEALIEAHRGLSAAQSAILNAKLILLLANQVGNLAVLRAAMAKAREGLEPAGEDATLGAVAQVRETGPEHLNRKEEPCPDSRARRT